MPASSAEAVRAHHPPSDRPPTLAQTSPSVDPFGALRGGVSGADAHAFSPYSPSFLGFTARGDRQPPSPEPILLAHFLVRQIYLEEVSAILAVFDDFRKAPFSSLRCGNAVGLVSDDLPIIRERPVLLGKPSALRIFQQPVPLGPDRSLGAVADPEPLEGAAQMSLDRLLADPETPGDLLVGQPSGHQSQD